MSNVIKKVYKNGVEYQIYGSAGAAGTGDVTGPASSVDGDIALFNGTTGKIIKDSGKKLSNYQTALSTQTAYTSKGSATKVPTITTNTLGQVTAISETNITFPVTSVNGSTGAVTVSEFNPGAGTDGQVVTKTNDGYGYANIPSQVDDTAFGSSWDGDTTHAPSKNAIYDVLGDVETLLAAL